MNIYNKNILMKIYTHEHTQLMINENENTIFVESLLTGLFNSRAIFSIDIEFSGEQFKQILANFLFSLVFRV